MQAAAGSSVTLLDRPITESGCDIKLQTFRDNTRPAWITIPANTEMGTLVLLMARKVRGSGDIVDKHLGKLECSRDDHAAAVWLGVLSTKSSTRPV